MHVAIGGAGIGGMTLAALLIRGGHEVTLVEKAQEFGEVGAGIQISPNGSRVLHHLGLGEGLAAIGTKPERIVLRRWKDDHELFVRRQGDAPIERYGFPYYNVYRPDLVSLLASRLEGVTTRFGTEVVGASTSESYGELRLADGSSIPADVVIGADGIHSAVRDSLFAAVPSRFSKYIAYRALVPRSAVSDLAIDVTNRMGPDSHLVTYFVGRDQAWHNLVCVVPEETWDVEGWNEPGDPAELRAHFADWSSEVNALLDHVIEPVHRWALFDREPMPTWHTGRVALLGDACHAMLPFMAQGACQAIEDAAVLCRLLRDPVDIPAALARYTAVRQPRAAELQRRSWKNATVYHLPDGPDQDRRDAAYASVGEADGARAFDWLYGYDPLTADL